MDIQNITINGTLFETAELGKVDFKCACNLYNTEGMKDEHGHLERADTFIEQQIEDDIFGEDVTKWLIESRDKGADIYTYHEGWQPIAEIAIYPSGRTLQTRLGDFNIVCDGYSKLAVKADDDKYFLCFNNETSDEDMIHAIESPIREIENDGCDVLNIDIDALNRHGVFRGTLE